MSSRMQSRIVERTLCSKTAGRAFPRRAKAKEDGDERVHCLYESADARWRSVPFIIIVTNNVEQTKQVARSGTVLN